MTIKGFKRHILRINRKGNFNSHRYHEGSITDTQEIKIGRAYKGRHFLKGWEE